ncbi:MAG: carboxy terminal-processing peptidase, partial [Janthinobacterium lividum]
AQGADGAMTEVVGWRVDDVVGLIRGAKDSVVRLDVLAAGANHDSPHKLVSLVRARISLDKQAARKTIIQVKDGGVTKQVGVITLPTFYQDTEARGKGDRAYKSATRDVTALLEELKKDKVDGVLIDLRNNGGGSLDEAVELTTLFTGQGPVVQIRNSQGGIKVESSKSGKQVWSGPLGVMVNRGSASASEIFAAAIQDYGRGVIIGEPSFGKGTVQSLVNLDDMAHNDKPKFGELKMTIAQFFRINGGTTQLRGVTPDIAFPIMSDNEHFGESSYENALPYSTIKPATFTAGDITGIVPQLQAPHLARIGKDKEFQYLIDDINEVKALRKKRTISLNEAERRRERDAEEAKLKLRTKNTIADAKKKPGKNEPTAIKKSSSQDTGLLADERSLSDELAAEKAAKDAKDPWLDEAAQIIGDEAGVMGALATAKTAPRAASAAAAPAAPAAPVR